MTQAEVVLSPAELRQRQARRAALALAEGDAWDLDLQLLLRDLPGDAGIQWISFMLPDGEEIFVLRRLLRKIGVEARRRSGRMKAGLRAWVDSRGLQLRWATGGFTLRTCYLDSSEAAQPMLRVYFSQRAPVQRAQLMGEAS